MENKTAVEVLLDKFQEIHKDFGGLDSEWLKLFDEALELEKQQMKEARITAPNITFLSDRFAEAEKYYSETYKKPTE